ncbi:MAG: hypothetical protein A2X86_14505 [Bdellovibrionales bacterium GWA2_49_15]|nr:MAG: hypothetical protein A2X86_14505 [Bdellovibrionales bacterium GWA2_49_15]HAZ13820.1 hypothetical protein [Bdellovibrionales bacterium]
MLAFALSAMASGPVSTLESWRFGEDYIIFVNLKDKGMRVNQGCEDATSSCLVWKMLASVSLQDLDASDLSGGKNIGASLCHKIENAQIVFARNAKGRQATFCAFLDGSMVDSGGLLLAAKMNAAKRGGR